MYKLQYFDYLDKGLTGHQDGCIIYKGIGKVFLLMIRDRSYAGCRSSLSENR